MKDQFIYHVALYLRLSRDDQDIDGNVKSESNSISSQRELGRSFVNTQEDMELFDIYVDDGYSGSNFDRPDFKRMMADIEAGNVNCVIVKDLSRLGRDYIEAGRLIQKTFPAFHVRFIALDDCFDSLTADFNTKSFVLPIKNFINDSYCRDISQKIKSQKKIKREKGEFIGPFTVYGYRKSEHNKNKICPDEYPAGVVKKIFKWKMDGMSLLAISDLLNELGILSPLEYKKSQGEKYTTVFSTGEKAKWSPVAVKRILTNEIYTGVMIQGKYEKVNYKVNKMRLKPESERIRVEGTHEAIISKDDFEITQRLLLVETRSGKGNRHPHLFTGFLFCGDCKEPMIRRINRYKDKENVYFICSSKNKNEGCSRHCIASEELEAVVFKTIQTYVSVFLDVSSQLDFIQGMEVDYEEIARFDKELRNLYKEKDKYLELRAALYEDLKGGVITEADFKSFSAIYERQYEETEQALQKQEDMIKQMFHNGVVSGVRLERFKKAMQFTSLDRDMLLAFVNCIEVYEDKRIYVELRYRQEFDKMLMLQEYLESKKYGEVI